MFVEMTTTVTFFLSHYQKQRHFQHYPLFSIWSD